MSSNNPCAVYNFYNCCDPSGASELPVFIWQSGNILDPQGPGPQEALGPVVGIGSGPDADLKSYQGLMPLHRKARLIELSLIKLPPFLSNISAYTSTVMLNLVVLDLNGVVIKTISTAPLNYQSLAVRTWIPIPVSTVPGDLDIPAGQLVAGEMIFGAPVASNQIVSMFYQLSGTGMLL
ncbi:MAG: hypothetical protein QOG23_4453 [Blastocatellia bacterium]|jgi:hypothetical protein|nr:hypothetical protein [Blastocatellia bacterium]